MKCGRFSRALATMTSVAFMAAACGGGQTSGGDVNYAENTFASNEDTVGRIDIDVESKVLSIGNTTEFKVSVLDANNRGVPNVRVACDSERGVAILEPLQGSSLVNQNGVISGLIGCAQPGSFQFGCRLASGANKRQFVGVKCEGEIPLGFAGFIGAAGGGLGGGVLPPEVGGPGGGSSGTIRLVALEAFGIGSSADESTSSIDIYQGVCGQSPNLTPEPFGDDFIRFSVRNDSPLTVTFSSYKYTVSGGLADGRDATSPVLRLTEEMSIEKNQVKKFSSLAFDAKDGRKVFASPLLQASEGFKIVTVTLFGQNSVGESITLRGSFTLSFDNFNVCGG